MVKENKMFYTFNKDLTNTFLMCRHIIVNLSHRPTLPDEKYFHARPVLCNISAWLSGYSEDIRTNLAHYIKNLTRPVRVSFAAS